MCKILIFKKLYLNYFIIYLNIMENTNNHIIRILSKIKYISDKVNKLFEYDYLKNNDTTEMIEIIDINDDNKL